MLLKHTDSGASLYAKEKGSGGLLAILVFVLAVIIGMASLSMEKVTVSNIKLSQENLKSIETFACAQGGLREAMASRFVPRTNYSALMKQAQSPYNKVSGRCFSNPGLLGTSGDPDLNNVIGIYRYIVLGGDTQRQATNNEFRANTLPLQNLPDQPLYVVAQGAVCRDPKTQATGQDNFNQIVMNSSSGELSCKSGQFSKLDTITLLAKVRLARLAGERDKVESYQVVKNPKQVTLGVAVGGWPVEFIYPPSGTPTKLPPLTTGSPFDFDQAFVNSVPPSLRQVAFYNPGEAPYAVLPPSTQNSPTYCTDWVGNPCSTTGYTKIPQLAPVFAPKLYFPVAYLCDHRKALKDVSRCVPYRFDSVLNDLKLKYPRLYTTIASQGTYEFGSLVLGRKPMPSTGPFLNQNALIRVQFNQPVDPTSIVSNLDYDSCLGGARGCSGTGIVLKQVAQYNTTNNFSALLGTSDYKLLYKYFAGQGAMVCMTQGGCTVTDGYGHIGYIAFGDRVPDVRTSIWSLSSGSVGTQAEMPRISMITDKDGNIIGSVAESLMNDVDTGFLNRLCWYTVFNYEPFRSVYTDYRVHHCGFLGNLSQLEPVEKTIPVDTISVLPSGTEALMATKDPLPPGRYELQVIKVKTPNGISNTVMEMVRFEVPAPRVRNVRFQTLCWEYGGCPLVNSLPDGTTSTTTIPLGTVMNLGRLNGSNFNTLSIAIYTAATGIK